VTNPNLLLPFKTSYRYKIKQASKGVKATVLVDAIEEIVTDYARLKLKLESEGL
jgi:hypothetical protein